MGDRGLYFTHHYRADWKVSPLPSDLSRVRSAYGMNAINAHLQPRKAGPEQDQHRRHGEAAQECYRQKDKAERWIRIGRIW